MSKYKSIGKKVKELKGNMTYEDFAKDIRNKTGYDIHWTTLQKYITGKRTPSIKTLEILAQYANKPLSFFVEEVPELRKKVERLEELKELKSQRDKLTEIIDIPILGEVPAGEPVEVGEEYIEGYYPLPKALYRREHFALRVKGDSMIDVGIEPGDLILVRKQPTAEIGQTVIARVNESEVTCKRFYIKNGRPVLEPANARYKTIEPEQLEIIGIVTRVIRDLD